MTGPLRALAAEVVVVGGGPAGAATAALLAERGHDVVVVERTPAYRWRACGVFASPAAVTMLRRVGLGDATIATAARPIPAMRVEPAASDPFRLTYGDDGSLRAPAVGLDREVLDTALLELAATRGARIRRGVTCAGVRIGSGGVVVALSDAAGPPVEIRARLLVGADGVRSSVARSLGVVRAPLFADRVGLTYHVASADATAVEPRDARMRVIRDGYVGLAPVPGGRVNIGIVLGRSWRGRLATEGAGAACDEIVRDAMGGILPERCDRIAGASPVGNRVSRRAGRGWLLVGDAAGFLDPFTGEGLHRALVSAALAASAGHRNLTGDRGALARYERAMRARFAGKDVVSTVVQAFLARPVLFGYAARRLATRDDVRETMGLVMGDLVPASRALDPRFLVALLRP